MKPRRLPLRVLLIDDSEDDTELLVRALRRSEFEVASERVDRPAMLASALENAEWDLVLADWDLVRMTGTEALSMVREIQEEVPFIFVSGTMGEDAAVRAMRNGAQDYIMKDNLSRLAPAVDRELRELRRRRDMRVRDAELLTLEVRFHKLITVAPDAVILTDDKGKITLANLGAERIFGYESKEIIGRPLEILLPGQVGPRAPQPGNDGEAGSTSQTSFTARRKGGTTFAAEGTISELVEGPRRSRMLILRDVSRRHRDEKELQLLQRVTLDASTAGTVDTALVQTIATICETLDFGIAEAWVPDERSPERLVCVARHCPDPRFRSFHGDASRSVQPSTILGEASADGQVLCVDDVTRDPRFRRAREARAVGLHGALVAPVIGSDGPVAVLLFLGADPVADPKWTETIMRRVASQLAIVIERKLSAQRLEHMAHHDALTGLPNRVLFMDRLQQSLADSKRRDRMLAVGFIDLDHFKQINDTLGHAVGDTLLQHVAGVLQKCLRAGDSVARIAGDEFAFVLNALHDGQEASDITRRLLDELARSNRFHGQDISISASVGLALYPDHSQDPDALLRHADIAMYNAKRRSPGTLRFFSAEMENRAKVRLDLENALRGAVDRGEFVLHYQPVVDVNRGRVHGVEALLRWRTADGTMLGPDAFIPIAEESGVIEALGQWVLTNACAEWRDRRIEFDEGFRLSVNVSPRQFQRGDLDATVRDVLRSTGFRPEQLDLEITENLLIDRQGPAVDVMRELGERGVQFSIDDFGTGYSNLNYIKDLPIRRLKIDRSFVDDLPHDENTRAIVSAIISMARSLGLDVIAEGVERSDQERFLVDSGVSLMQGHLYCRAMAPDRLLDWWRGWTPAQA